MNIFALLGFVPLTDAHSWIHCTDYRGDVANYEDGQCFGHPRPKGGAFPDAGAFGVDRGFDTQAGACQSYDQNSNTAAFPAATYKRGQTVTLAWPSKNHVAATCTNPFIPDTSTKLFVAPHQSMQTPTGLTQVSASFSDDPHVNGQIDFKGFQNCPDFCSNTDKSLCTGTFTVPTGLADGTYTFQWEWVFNQGAGPYVSCFEATIAGADTGGGGDSNDSTDTGTGDAPTPPPTTPAPTTEEEKFCGAAGNQCDGALFNGVNCCRSGLECHRHSQWFSMCLDECPDNQGWECDETPQQGSGCSPDETGMNYGLGVAVIFLIAGAAVFGVLYGRCWERKKLEEEAGASQDGLEKAPKKASFDNVSVQELQRRRSTLTMPAVEKKKAPRRPAPRRPGPPAPPAAAFENRVSVV